MKLDVPFIYHVLQDERDIIVTWFILNEGLCQLGTTPRGTTWYSGPRWVMALAYGVKLYYHHYKVVIWDDELATQFALRFGVTSYTGRSNVGEVKEIKIYETKFDESIWTQWVQAYL